MEGAKTGKGGKGKAGKGKGGKGGGGKSPQIDPKQGTKPSAKDTAKPKAQAKADHCQPCYLDAEGRKARYPGDRPKMMDICGHFQTRWRWYQVSRKEDLQEGALATHLQGRVG